MLAVIKPKHIGGVYLRMAHAHEPATWLVLVPVCEGKRHLGVRAAIPEVRLIVISAHEADPVVQATVGPARTEQAVDESLLKPTGESKDR